MILEQMAWLGMEAPGFAGAFFIEPLQHPLPEL
jgi:hypothetical protein